MSTLTPANFDDVVTAVREHARVLPHGTQTKAPLVSDEEDAVRLNMTQLTGINEYEPDEFTFTALAGTPLTKIAALLAEHGQYMPFDPPLGDSGATIGGTLAAGLNGPGRLRYGGLRDFVIGVRFVDGVGKVVHGGGKVVKNAAGFDLPKLLVGSMGRLGVIVELTFKVFPAPRAWCSLRVTCRDLEDAVSRIADLCRLPLELEAVDLEPPNTLVIRVSGDETSLTTHAQRVGEVSRRPYELLGGGEEAGYWQAQRGFAWVEPGRWLIKVPLTPRLVLVLDRALDRQEVQRRYSVAGNVAWLAWPEDRSLTEFDLAGLRGLVVRGAPLQGASPWIETSPNPAGAFGRSIKNALDPDRRFAALV